MSDSKLSFSSSENFRKNLVTRNLAPYQVQGVYTPPANDINYETVLSDSGVIDSPDNLISEDPFADNLYPLNQYGPEGGFEKNITYNNPPLPIVSNDGPYQPTDTVMDLVNEFFIDTAYIQNQYGPEGGYQNMIIITDIQNNNNVYLPYWEPPIFRPSSYNAYSILISDNPVGSDGSLSQDSYVVKLGAIRLQDLLKYRAALSDNKDAQLIGDYSAFSDPQAASTFLRGNLIVPENDFEKAGNDLVYNRYFNLEDLKKDSFEVPHPDGPIEIKVPTEFDTSKPLRVKSKGFNTNGVGDLFIKLFVRFRKEK
jgi:hypothetical protein